MKKTEKEIRALKPDVELDITDQVCPLTFVRTRLKLEQMAPGQWLRVRLKGREPLENVPRSVTEQGDRVVALLPEDATAAGGSDTIHLLWIEKA